MIKRTNSFKFLKNINLIISKLIKKNLNKFNIVNFYKVTKSNKFFLSLVMLIILFLSYLSIPNIYDKNEISKKLDQQLLRKLNLRFNLSQNFEYKFLPRPHFIFRDSFILKDEKEISKIEELKIFISLNNLFSYENFNVQNIILEKSNFNLDYQTYNFFIKLLDSNFKDGNLTIKDSNVFFKNKDDEVLFINKILIMEYFYDNKSLQNKTKSKNKIFNLPYSIELNKDNIEKKFYSKLNLNFLKLKVENKFDFSNEVKKGMMNFILNKDKYNVTYDFNENEIIFNLFDNFEEPKFSYEGKFNFDPFYSSLKGKIKEINTLHLLNSNALVLQLLKTKILNNRNLNFDLNIYSDKSQYFSDFVKIYLNSKIKEGLIDIDKTQFSWRDNADFFLEDSLIYVKDGELILDGKLNLIIKNSDEVYKFLLTPKDYRNELTNIKANFVYNFDLKIINFNNILIDNKSNKEVNKVLESLLFKKNKIKNRVYLKKVLNRALKVYSG